MKKLNSQKGVNILFFLFFIFIVVMVSFGIHYDIKRVNTMKKLYPQGLLEPVCSKILKEQQAYPSWRTGIYIATLTTISGLFFYYLYLDVKSRPSSLVKSRPNLKNHKKIGFCAILSFVLVWAVATSFTRVLIQHIIVTPYDNGDIVF
jgi:hypothetical protein